MNLFTKLLLFWPIIIIVSCTLIFLLTTYFWFAIPVSRPIIVIIAIIGIIQCFSTISYSSPNSWWARSLFSTIIPDPKSINWNLKDKSKFDHHQQAIYIWYPHSHFAMGPFGFVAGDMGNSVWKRPVALCSAPPFFDIPAIRQISLGFGSVRSDYDNMKGTLKQGTSLLIIPGGAREVTLAEPGKMKLLDDRKGFLRLAEEFGLPLIPIFCFGENEFFKRPESENVNIAHTVLKTFGGGFQPPTWSSIKEWFRRPEQPLNVFVGTPFKIDGLANSSTISDKWKKHVNQLYKKYRPANYANEIEWVPKSSL